MWLHSADRFRGRDRRHAPRHVVTSPSKLPLKLCNQRRRALVLGCLKRCARHYLHQPRHRCHRQEHRQRENGQEFAAESHRVPFMLFPIMS